MPKPTARLLLALIILLPLAGCHKKVNPALVGEWEAKTTGNKKVYLAFAADGHLVLEGDISSLAPVLKSFSILTDFSIRPAANTITYKCVGDNKMEIEGDFTALLEKLSAGGSGTPSKEAIEKLHPKDTVTYAISGKELTLTHDQGGSLKLQKAE